MTAPRSIREERMYRRYRRDHKGEECPFCGIAKGHEQYVEETRYFKVIRNRIPYSIWDGQGVLEHLMIAPKSHTDRLGSLHARAAVEYIGLIDKYESAGYNVYARAPTSSVKSIVHQHTHLIKLDGKDKRFVLIVHRPLYVRLSR